MLLVLSVLFVLLGLLELWPKRIDRVIRVISLTALPCPCPWPSCLPAKHVGALVSPQVPPDTSLNSTSMRGIDVKRPCWRRPLWRRAPRGTARPEDDRCLRPSAAGLSRPATRAALDCAERPAYSSCYTYCAYLAVINLSFLRLLGSLGL